MIRQAAVRVGFLVIALAGGEAAATQAATASFSGSGARIVVPNAPALNPTVGFTLEAWVRPTRSDGCRAIWSKDHLMSVWLGLCEGRVQLYTGGATTWRRGNKVLPVGQWSHVAVTFDGTVRRYYIDGVLDLQESTPGLVGMYPADVTIGASETGANPFEGNLAEVRLWDVARPLADIRRDMTFQLASPRPRLIAVWPLEASPADALGLHPGTVVGAGLGFAGSAAPPRPQPPYAIPRLGSAPTLDGTCTAGEYADARVPLWFTPPGQPPLVVWAHVGAGSTDLYLCVERMPRRSWAGSSSLSLYLDVGAEGGAFAMAGDYRLTLTDVDTRRTEQGNGAGGWADAGLSTFQFNARSDSAVEFVWTVELRVNRSLFPAQDSPFRLGLAQHDQEEEGAAVGWPVDWAALAPDTWTLAIIDDSRVPRPDAAPPTATARHVPADRQPGVDEPVRLIATGRDDVDLASLTLWVDFVAVKTCDFPGTSDQLIRQCVFEDTFPVGPHRYQAEAIDHRGRSHRSGWGTFRVQVDGEPPVLETSHSPETLAEGQAATLRAEARDAAGLRTMTFELDAPPYSHRCTFTTETMGSCSLTVRPRAGQLTFSYLATATDAEGFTRTAPRRTVLVNGGPDSDADGLSDAVEAVLCTLPGNPDSDRDGLLDGWEVRGLSFDDGDRVDLPGLGANPCHRDIFLQYDFERGARLDDGAVETVVTAFRDHGVRLSVTENERPRPLTSAQSPLGAVTAAHQRAGGAPWFDPKLNWTHYYAYSRHFVGRSGAWARYFTFDIHAGNGLLRDDAGTYLVDGSGNPIGGTCACPLDLEDPGQCRNDFPFDSPCRREGADGQARRFMHELGHMIGMGHGGRTGGDRQVRAGDYLYYEGGWDDGSPGRNQKPNYVSVMNYLYNGGLLCMLPPEEGDTWPRFVSSVDYSGADLGPLDERALDERPTSSVAGRLTRQACPVADEGAVPVLLYTCSDPDEDDRRYLMVTDGRRTVARLAQGGPFQVFDLPAHPPGIDWNCNGRIESRVAGSVNGNGGDFSLPGEPCNGVDDNGNGAVDEGCNWTANQTDLAGHDDWQTLPRPPECLKLYDTRGNCYPQVRSYVDAIAGPDCRPSGAADAICPTASVILDSGPPEPVVDESFGPSLPGTETCDSLDNDQDGEIDEGCRDTDGDGVSDGIDNCPRTPNPDQADRDDTALGDDCEQIRVLLTGDSVAAETAGIALTWTASNADTRGFNVYRVSPDAATLAFQGQSHPTTTEPTFADPVVEADGDYRFHVRAVDLNGQEGPDAVIRFTLAGGSVTDVVLGPPDDGAQAPDAGVPGDGGVEPPPGGETGCGCGAGASGAAIPALLLLGLLRGARRRARPRTSSRPAP